jgi:hypothetical protein
MTIWIRIAVLALAVISVVAQAPSGEIAGRMSDGENSPLPGVRIRVTSGGQSREAETGSDGRFLISPLPMGSYRVVTDLAGFTDASGQITISASTPRAFLDWSLEISCIAEVHRVPFSPREAAALVQSIVHLRVVSDAGRVRVSDRPNCEGEVFHEYKVQVLGSTPGRGRTNSGPRQMFVEPRGVTLTAGQEYLALLWPDGYSSDELILPIISGRVVSPGVSELNGLSATEALSQLAKWAEQRQR